MSWTRRIYRKFRSSDGRFKIATLFGVSAAVAALALLVGILPAMAGAGLESDAGVVPTEITYGGGSGACASIGSSYDELHINNPTSGIFETADGEVQVVITVDESDEVFSYSFVDPTFAAFQVIVNGGRNNTVFDNQAHGGPLPADGSLHAPTKGNSLTNLFKLSHINICYGVFIPNVEGTKYHDRDTDGEIDETEEEGLGGWTIAAFDGSGFVSSTQTGIDGTYTLGNLGTGEFTICEAPNTEGLPPDDPDPDPTWTWAWTQSEPDNTNCPAGYEPGGHTVDVTFTNTLVPDVDFGNHFQVTVDCSGSVPVTVPRGGEETDPPYPLATLTFPPECRSGTTTFSFDVGLSDPDDDEYRQVVIVGLDAEDLKAEVVGLTIEWDAEKAVYVNGSLLVPTTQVLLDLGGVVPDDLEPATFCNTNADLPDFDTPQCLDSRTIAEGGDLSEGYIQLIEDYLLFGDPGHFR
jgi:hypothetical protein